jgi:hypothetical protein
MANLLAGFSVLATSARVAFLIPNIKQIFFWQFPQLKDNITIEIKTPGFHWLPPNPRFSPSV